MSQSRISVVVACAALLLSACGGFHIRTPVAARPQAFAGFEVGYGPEIPPDRQRVLDAYGVPEEMAAALRGAYPAGQGPFVRVILTQFRSGRWGPTRMHAVVQVLGPAQQVLNQFDVDSTTVVGSGGPGGPHQGSRATMILRVSQDVTNQIAQQL